jgi:hypothetical protein
VVGRPRHRIPTQDAAGLAGDLAGFLRPAGPAREPPPPAGPAVARG